MTDIGRPPSEIAQLCLLLSRAELDEAAKATALRLIDLVEDWAMLTGIVIQKYSVPWVYAHLEALAPGKVPADLLQQMQGAARHYSMRAMRVLSDQMQFQKTCLDALGVPYAFMKGPSLAARYYANPGLRFSRDIDVLVSAADHAKVLHRALAEGYLVWEGRESAPDVPDAGHLDAMLRYQGSVPLVTKSGVMIELHRDIDKFSGLFNPDALLAARTEIAIANDRTWVLPTPQLFTYICYHHTRHIWSKLHWLADLDAIVTHPDFDEAACLRYAEGCGLRPTVEACLGFHRLTLLPETWDDVPEDRRDGQMLALCLDNLLGDVAHEYAQRAHYGLLAIPFDWMLERRAYWSVMRRHLISRLRPSYEQYSEMPLPARMQFVYYVTRPLAALKRRLFGMAERRR